MYRRQMILQKVLCIIALIMCAAVFVYSLGIMTDIYDLVRGKNNIGNETNPYDTTVSGSWIYYEMQPFNRTFSAYSIVMLLLAVFLFITNTHVRRRYYFANFLSTGLYTAGSVYFSFWAHTEIEYYKAEFLKIDFEALKAVADKMKGYYTESTILFDIHYGVFGLLLLSALLLVFNLCFKLYLMRAEKKLLAAGASNQSEDAKISADRMRYTKNTASSRLCYLAILLDVFYFVNIYSSDMGSWYYNVVVGGSIVYNLLFMLFVFLGSEGVKNYRRGYSMLLYIVGILQPVRIFIIPYKAMHSSIMVGGAAVQVMSMAQGVRAIVWLVLSCVCLLIAGRINSRKCAQLAFIGKGA